MTHQIPCDSVHFTKLSHRILADKAMSEWEKKGRNLIYVRKLQLVQNTAARLLSGTGHRDHITACYSSSTGYQFASQAEFKVLVLTYRALNGLGPSYLKDCISL